MQFKDIVNQHKTKENVIKLFNESRLPHALLFLGKKGVGGLPIAVALAQYIFCENKTDSDSCGRCSSCLKIKKLAHPDLHFSFPTIGPKPNLSNNFLPQFREFFAQTPYADVFEWLQFINAENKQGNISADECRNIIDQLNITAFEGGYKIQIIWMPEYLGKEGNILLKLIEEPPHKTLLFLVAEEEESILPTILSRTQKIALAPLSPKDIAEALIDRFEIEETLALKIANTSENSFAQALYLYQNSNQNDWLPLLKNWFNAIFTKNALLTSEWVRELDGMGREQQKRFLTYVIEILSYSLRVKLAANYHPPILSEELDFVQKLAKQAINTSTYKMMERSIEKTIYHIGRNAHSKTQLLYLSIQMQYLISGHNLEVVVPD